MPWTAAFSPSGRCSIQPGEPKWVKPDLAIVEQPFGPDSAKRGCDIDTWTSGKPTASSASATLVRRKRVRCPLTPRSANPKRLNGGFGQIVDQDRRRRHLAQSGQKLGRMPNVGGVRVEPVVEVFDDQVPCRARRRRRSRRACARPQSGCRRETSPPHAGRCRDAPASRRRKSASIWISQSPNSSGIDALARCRRNPATP